MTRSICGGFQFPLLTELPLLLRIGDKKLSTPLFFRSKFEVQE